MTESGGAVNLQHPVVAYAWKMLFTPYIFGGAIPGWAIDCSGVVVELLKAFSVLHYRDDLNAKSLAVRLARDYKKCSPCPGAIVFFGTESICHVGIAISENLMIEAGGGASNVNTQEQARAVGAFVRVRPISMRKDYAFAILPTYADVE